MRGEGEGREEKREERGGDFVKKLFSLDYPFSLKWPDLLF